MEGEVRQRERLPGGTAAAWLSIRLRGQGYELRVRVPDECTVRGVEEAFQREYTARFGRPPWSADREVVDWIVQVTWPQSVPAYQEVDLQERQFAITHTKAFFGPEFGWRDARVLDRAALRRSGPVAGPLLMPEPGTTVVVAPRQYASVDEFGNVHVELQPPGDSEGANRRGASDE
jgi:N-methylhydantoinase A/oxoprolinase/acetone carboxylase beta subunit